ncbi:acyl-CoA N-acyltransferase [Pholiota conissans]|uniref:Acyl-CoA N-acyltransferase n=1 Tax=Pholiota conissans TaxID=109636 RepID=A0A9P5YVD6_9AGAR|nr:acyl-CoA N-acyltransferase [Pholiota conissans]
MFLTNRLVLRGYRPSDQDFFLDLFDTYNVLSNLTADITAPGYDNHRDMLGKMTKCALFVVVEDKETHETMGFTLVNVTTPRDLDGEVGMALAEKWWGKGYATEIMEWLLGYSFKILGLRRLSLFVFSSNERAISLYENIGFKHEGRKREALWKEGRWVDLVWMGMLSREYSPTTEQAQGNAKEGIA